MNPAEKMRLYLKPIIISIIKAQQPSLVSSWDHQVLKVTSLLVNYSKCGNTLYTAGTHV